VISLLDSIGVAGATETARATRVSALKDARAPLQDVSAQFGAGPNMALAP
jgi:hypothetical protein